MAATDKKENHQNSGHRLLFTVGVRVDRPLFDYDKPGYHPGYDPETRLFLGYPVKRLHDGSFFVYVYSVEENYPRGSDELHLLTSSFMSAICDEHKNSLRNALEPHGCWDETRFGVWVFS